MSMEFKKWRKKTLSIVKHSKETEASMNIILKEKIPTNSTDKRFRKLQLKKY